LCSDVVVIPPLRQRLAEDPEELDALLGAILGRITGGATERERMVIRRVVERDAGPTHNWPGNVRELEQAVKRILLTGHYKPDASKTPPTDDGGIVGAMAEGRLTARQLLSLYCARLYQKGGTFEEVARRTGLDRRTAKKYALEGLGDVPATAEGKAGHRDE
jgi:DNA-binding NtrC family response regulator